jgi:hypothetical protein
MNIKNSYQYIKLFLGIAVISLILFCGGCNEEWLQDDSIVEEPIVENVESVLKPESCKKTRGFTVHGHEKEETNCQP